MKSLKNLILLTITLSAIDKHLLYDWIEKNAPDEVIKFAVTRLSKDQLNLIKDKKLKQRALKIKEKADCKSSF